jgi:hypothetical protein
MLSRPATMVQAPITTIAMNATVLARSAEADMMSMKRIGAVTILTVDSASH